MALFTSKKEKRLWLYSATVAGLILSTLVIGNPLRAMMTDQDIQAVFFLLGMALVGALIITYGITRKPHISELAVLFGFAAVGLMFFLRLGLAERSHLIEYCVLALFVHSALTERFHQKMGSVRIALIAFIATVLFGVIDECLQIAMPERVFDPLDIFFNSSAAFFAIAGSLSLGWMRRRIDRKN